MYKGFKIPAHILKGDPHLNKYYYAQGLELFEEHKVKIEKSLLNFIKTDSALDGSKIQKSWFPTIEADIFISHSHNDAKMAITLAGYLKDNFGIFSFIDSCIWGYANDLLKEIDKDYCYDKTRKTYNYNTRNYSTSHVHMMLSTALASMIQKTECLFFLDTPHSIKPADGIRNTQSPWIYFEIKMSALMGVVIPPRIQKRINASRTKLFNTVSDKEKLLESMLFDYEIDDNHLIELSIDQLNEWQIKAQNLWNKKAALDKLYEIAGISHI